MSYDGVATAAAVSELQQNLTLGKIEKIYQPHSEQLIFNIHTKAGRKKLLLSVSGNHAGAYLTETVPENPASPPVFCMVMRKHLNAGRITQIQQHENDRIIEILLETVNEMGFSVNKKLIIEIMGKHSNVILTDMTSGKIIDSIKHISIDVNRARQILPGKLYEYPPAQKKIPFTKITREEILQLLTDPLQPGRCLLSGIQGLSPALAETLASDLPSASDAAKEFASSVYSRLQKLIQEIREHTFTPVVYLDGAGKPVDFHITDLSIYGTDYTAKSFDTFSQAAEFYFQNRESSNLLKQKSGDLIRIINGDLSRLRHKTQKLNEDLYRAENSDKYRLYGELLTANLHQVKPGASSVTVISYYDGSEVKIPLDPKYAPSKNAQIYYKKYGKAKTAVKEKKIQLEEVSQEIAYLESVLEFTEKAHSVEELRTIRQELTDSGFLRYRKNRNTKEKTSKPSPYAYTLTSGKRVFAGRNNKENDWLTLKKASSTDIWFHTKDIPGSHVILFTEGQEPSKEELFETAAIAAWHSKGSSSENVPVDYTRVKYVKKPAGSKPGMVIFTHNKTLYVDPALPVPDHTAEK